MRTQPDSVLPPFYKKYVDNVKDYNLPDALTSAHANTQRLIASIPEELGQFRYADGKWSIKELICHMMDAERIFAYRALRFARNDSTGLPGFEENDYAPQANAHGRTLKELSEEFNRLRRTTIDLYQSFTPEMLSRTGSANNSTISVINLGYVIAGHEVHHYNILKERYLKK